MGFGDKVRQLFGGAPDSAPDANHEPPLMKASDLFAHVETWEARKQTMKRRWKEVIAAYDGIMWGDWQTSSAATSYIPIKRAEGGSQLSMNLFQAYVGALVSMLTRAQPIPRTDPMGDNPEDEQRALICDSLLRHIWQLTDAQDKVEETVQWAALNAAGFAMVYWDTMLKGPTEYDEQGQPYNIGAPAIAALSPFCVGFNDTTAFEKSPWVYHHHVATPEDIDREFNVWCEPDTYPEDITHGGVLRFETKNKGSKPFAVEITRYWEKPCRKYPDGRHIVATRKKVLLSDVWPENRPWPIHMLGLERAPGNPWFRTPFYDYLEVNRTDNKVISDIVDHVTVGGYPQVMALKGQVKRMSRAPGAVNEWEKGSPADPPPTMMTVNPMPGWILQVPKLMGELGGTILGITDVSLGQAPFSRMSQRAGAMFLEQTNNRYANASLRLGRFLCGVGMHFLQLWREHGPIQETIRVVGNSGMESYKLVQREEISFRTLHMEPTEVMAQSRVAQMETLEKWLQYQAIDPNDFKSQMVKFWPSLGDIDPKRLDVAWAKRNINAMKLGNPVPPPAPPMIFAVHYEVQAEYQKTSEFLNLDPQIQAIFNQHLQALATLIQQSQAMNSPPGGSVRPGAASPEATPERQIPGRPSPGPQGVAPELNGGMNFGVDTGAEAQANRGAGS